MSATRRALDGLVEAITAVGGGATVGVALPGEPAAAERPDVVVTPLSVTRLGRSRRLGSLLDLELLVAVEAGGPDVLDLVERLLVAAEAVPHTRIEPLPAERAGFGFVVALPASVALAEPTAPPVREVVVELAPLVAVSGTVVDATGTGLPGVQVASSLTRQATTTDAAGRFALAGLSRPTTLTVSRGARRTTLDVPADPSGLRVVLPNHEGE